MGENVTLTAKDGFKLGAYVAHPAGKPKGGVVVIQEIFGVNHHIRAVADSYAQQGYLAVAPAIFDRVHPDFQVGYTQEDVQKGFGLVQKSDRAKMLEDVQAAIDEAAKGGKVGVVGYCLGGTLTFAAACNLNGVAAAAGYYGGQIATMCEQKPKAPTILHFGETDHSIPMTDVEKIKAARPETPCYVYPGAGHGFNCDERGAFQKEARDLALSRTLEFFGKHL